MNALHNKGTETRSAEMKMPPSLAKNDPVWNVVVLVAFLVVVTGGLLLIGSGLFYLLT